MAPLNWRPRLEGGTGPAYLRIVGALAADIESGRLPEGTRLPPQRELSEALGLNLSTITRALSEARRRGLVTAVIGRGTFVADLRDRAGEWGRAGRAGGAGDAFLDLSFNAPPEPAGVDLGRLLAAQLAAMGRSPERCRGLTSYHTPAGSMDDREAACGWLAARAIPADPARLLVCAGAQHALYVALAAVTSPGDVVLCEDLTYPGFLNLARMLRLRLVGVRSDEEGLDPDAFRAAVERHEPRLAFCSPTIQNPTTSVLSRERRDAISSTALERGLLLLEDDAYGPLVEGAPPSLASFAAGRTLHVSGLSKTLAPGLRVGYLVVPDAATFDRCESVLQATMWMVPPLMAAIASTWLRDGTAGQVLRGIRAELEVRNRIVREQLEGLRYGSHPASSHVWLGLGEEREEGVYAARARERGVGIVAGTAFRAPGAGGKAGLRVCLGPARSEAALRHAFAVLGGLLRGTDAASVRLI